MTEAEQDIAIAALRVDMAQTQGRVGACELKINAILAELSTKGGPGGALWQVWGREQPGHEVEYLAGFRDEQGGVLAAAAFVREAAAGGASDLSIRYGAP